jgi:hypothetical protein
MSSGTRLEDTGEIHSGMPEGVTKMPLTETDPELVSWRCYHCGQLFTDTTSAAEHFGGERYNPRPAACQEMLQAMAETFEQYGVHRNFHNAASIKIMYDKMAGKIAEMEAEIEHLRRKLADILKVIEK